MHRPVLTFVMTGLLALACLPAVAADNGFYLGASVGQAAVDVDDLGDGFGSTDFSGEDFAFKVFAGYRFLNFFAVEGSYLDLGAPDEDLAELDGRFEADITGFDAFAVGLLPLGLADVFVKAGLITWDADFTADLGDLSETLSDDGTDPAYGIGLQLRFRSFAVRGEVEYFDIDGAESVYMYSIGGSLTF